MLWNSSRKTTIREVAQAASGRIGRFPRAQFQLSGEPETRARVLEAIRRLGFRPNAQAPISSGGTECVLSSEQPRFSSIPSCAHPARRRILCHQPEATRALCRAAFFPKTPPDRIDLPPFFRSMADRWAYSAGTIYPNLLRRIEYSYALWLSATT